MVAGGACVVGGVRGCWGVCMVAGGHVWLWGACVHGCWGACMVEGGHVCMWGCAWLRGMHRIQRDMVNERAVHILLECILVTL